MSTLASLVPHVRSRSSRARSLLCFLSALVGCSTAGFAAPPAGRGFTLAFEDNFDGTALDTTAWRYRTDARSIPATSPQCANLATNVSVSGGYLRLTGKVENYTTGGVTYPSTGGGVISNADFKYGYYETRAKLTKLPGWHQSFWQLGSLTSGAYNEIDGWEVDSHASQVLRYNTHHYEPAHDTWLGASYTLPAGGGTGDIFRVYAWEWSPTEVIFYVDGVERARIPYPGAHAAQSVWLTCLGWDRGSGRAGPVEIQFDYLRYYAKDYGITSDYGTIVAPSTAGGWGVSGRAFNHDNSQDTKFSSSAGDTATWTPNLPSTGNYEVFFWNPSYFKSTTTSAALAVTGAGGAFTAPAVDQVYDGQQWVSLGAYRFNAGSGGYVRLTVPNPSGGVNSRVGAMMFRRFDLADYDFDSGSASGWTTEAGTWNVAASGTGYAYRTTTTTETLVRLAPQGWQNHFVRASVRPVGANVTVGVVGRYVDANNYYMLRIYCGSNQVSILKRAGGTWTTLATVNFAVTPGVWYDLMLVMDGNKLRGLVNGFEYIDAVDSTHTAGTVGVRTYGGEAWFDRFGVGH